MCHTLDYAPRLSRRTIASAVCTALVIAVGFAGNAFAGVPGFAAAKAFHRYPVYWAGAQVPGSPAGKLPCQKRTAEEFE